jgi:pyrroline-5-carboxylate reductase
MNMSKIGCIGTGNMGGALARAIGKSGHEVYLSDYSRQKAQEVALDIGKNARISDNKEIAAECDMILLGVKPQMLAALATELSPLLSARKTRVCLVSMAAGISLSRLAELFGTDASVIRIMPNIPVCVGAGVILFTANAHVSEGDKALFGEALRFAGTVDELAEGLFDAASALSGCGPAFVCLFTEALADGAVRCGLPRDKALRYAAETLKGTALLLEQSGKHPGTVKDEVCSPGGSTIEGVAALEEGGFRALAMDAVTAAYERTMELGKK